MPFPAKGSVSFHFVLPEPGLGLAGVVVGSQERKEGGLAEMNETYSLAVVQSLDGALLAALEFCLLLPLSPRLSFPFLSCSLSNSGMYFFITTGWLSSIVTVICGSSRHLRIEIDLGHLCSRGVIAVVTAPVSKATAFWL